MMADILVFIQGNIDWLMPLAILLFAFMLTLQTYRLTQNKDIAFFVGFTIPAGFAFLLYVIAPAMGLM